MINQGIARFVAVDAAGADGMRGFRLAIVASEDFVYGMSRMYGMQTEGNAKVRSFRDADEARRWLGLPT